MACVRDVVVCPVGLFLENIESSQLTQLMFHHSDITGNPYLRSHETISAFIVHLLEGLSAFILWCGA
jgi:hypothetical protein